MGETRKNERRRTVLVTGANGFGGMVARAAVDHGWDVVASTRNEATRARALAAGLEIPRIVCIDYCSPSAGDPGHWVEVLAELGVDAVINCAMRTPKSVPRADLDPEGARRVNDVVPRALAAACESLDVALVQLSPLHAHLHAPDDSYRATKDRFRTWLEAFTAGSTLRSVVAEMGIVTHPGRGHYRLELLCALGIAVVPTGNVGLNPIDARDAAAGLVGLAEALIEGDETRVPRGSTVTVAGPESVDWKTFFGRIRTALGLGPSTATLPLPCNRLSAAVVEWARRLSIPLPGGADGFDILELDREFRVPSSAAERFRAASGLESFRDPMAAYRELRASGWEPPGPVEALRVLTQRVTPDSPPLALPTARIVRERVLVVGATGFMGPTIVEELIREGHPVVGTVRSLDRGRRQLDLPGVELVRVDLEEEWTTARFHELLETHGIDVVINNAGACTSGDADLIERVNHRVPRALVAAADRVARRRPLRLIQISSTGVYWDDWAEISYTRAKRLLDEEIENCSHLDWVIVRPNMVLEPGRGHVPLEDVAKLPVLPYLRDESIQPIDNRELAIGIARLARNSVTRVVLDASGPEVTTWPELMNTVRQAMGMQPAPCARVPGVSGARAVIGLLHRLFGGEAFGKLAALDDETFRVAGRGSVRDTTAWLEATGLRPWSLRDSYTAWFAGTEARTIFIEEMRSCGTRDPGSCVITVPGSGVGRGHANKIA